MLTLKIVGLVILLLAISFLIMGFNIFFRKRKFPVYEVGHNKEMNKLGITCAKYDEIKCHKKAMKSANSCCCG